MSGRNRTRGIGAMMRETPQTRSEEDAQARVERERNRRGASCRWPRCAKVDSATLDYKALRSHMAAFIASHPEPVSTANAAEHVGVSTNVAAGHLNAEANRRKGNPRVRKVDKHLWASA
jgi:hypothetical protein